MEKKKKTNVETTDMRQRYENIGLLVETSSAVIGAYIETIKEFLFQYVGLMANHNSSRMGLITYADKPRLHFNFYDDQNKALLRAMIEGIR